MWRSTASSRSSARHVKGGRLGDDLAIVLLENTAGKSHEGVPGESESVHGHDDEEPAARKAHE